MEFDVDGVIFDLGSTLLEYENIPWATLNIDCLKEGYAYLEREGYDLPSVEEFLKGYIEVREKFRLQAEKTLKEWVVTDAFAELLDRFGLNTRENLARDVFHAYYQPVKAQLSVYADSAFVLESIKKSGRTIGLVSNTIFPEAYHRSELEKYGLLKYLDFAVFSSSFGYRKPHRTIYERAVVLAEIPPPRLLFVGDRYLEDCRGPRENGLNAVLKYWAGRDYPDPMPGDVHVVKSLTEILPLIMDEFDGSGNS